MTAVALAAGWLMQAYGEENQGSTGAFGRSITAATLDP